MWILNSSSANLSNYSIDANLSTNSDKMLISKITNFFASFNSSNPIVGRKKKEKILENTKLFIYYVSRRYLEIVESF